MPNEMTLLRLCVLRALEHASDGTVEWKPGTWDVMSASARGAKVAGFIALWATLMGELGRAELSIEDYADSGYEGRRTSYRRLADFRAMFPEHRNPNALASQLLVEARRRRAKPTADLAIAV